MSKKNGWKHWGKKNMSLKDATNCTQVQEQNDKSRYSNKQMGDMWYK